MEHLNLKLISEELIQTFTEAGKLSIYLRKKGLKKDIKKDNTPVTNGDLEVNKLLIKKIKNLTKDIPIISEESSDNKEIDHLNNFWLIDPIDGTYDYVNGKDEFTINAALVVNKKPKFGIIYAPAKERLFYAYKKNECYEISFGRKIKLKCKKKTQKDQVRAVVYSENLKPMISEIHKKNGVTEIVKMKIVGNNETLYCDQPLAGGHAPCINQWLEAESAKACTPDA